MSQPDPVTKKCCKPSEEEEILEVSDSNQSFLQCAELILPWLTPPELANLSLTCKTLYQFSKSVTLCRSSDASRTFENLPIPFQNAVDNHPYTYFTYTPSQVHPYYQSIRQCWGSNCDAGSDTVSRLVVESVQLVDEWGETVSGCDCEHCEDVGNGGFECPCLRFGGFEDMVGECGPSCECGLECGKRATQRGVSVRLKIVRDRRKGWGLYANQFIPKGQFVCEYAGELLTTEEARKRQQMYDELASGGSHLSSALLVVREHLPSGNSCLRMNIDATRMGNVGRFINHSCDGGNLATKLVRSSGSLLPRLCFFASRSVEKNEELSFSYGDIRLSPKGLQCFCGSSCCFGILPSEHT